MELGEEWSPYTVFGMSRATQQAVDSPAGETLPPTTHTGGDRGAQPWHPDSPAFWVAVMAAATVLGVFGASFNVRAGHGKAGVSVGAV